MVTTIIWSLKSDKCGASAAEYALIVAVLASFVVAGSLLFATSLNDSMVESANSVAAVGSSVPVTP